MTSLKSQLEKCALCGAEIDHAYGGCPVCLPHPDHGAQASADAAAPPTGTHGPSAPQADVQPLEFEAEEQLARGDATRALVLASNALKQRPESLTLRGLVDRARKTVLRGRRGERLEQRLREAHELLEGGDLRGAEAIATSALKLVPNHAQALALFTKIKEGRLAADTVETEVERELVRIGAAQARQAASRARALRGEGNERGAFVAVRRGLRHTPDDAELLALFAELQQSLGNAAEAHAALRDRLEQARRQLAAGQISESRDTLRAALRDDPDFAPAQALMQEVRAAFLARGDAASLSRGTIQTVASKARSLPVSQVLWAKQAESSGPRALVALEALRARRRRRTTFAVVLAIGLPALGAALFWAIRVYQAIPTDDVLRREAPELRSAVTAALGDYKAALEALDAPALERARPDLPAEARDALIAALREASAAAVELRVVGVEANAQRARVHISRTVVVTSSPRATLAPVEETLRFVRRGEAWHLR